MKNLKISIIIPAYNHGKELVKCLDSIYAQTFDDFEIIVVNDGSTDDTEEALRMYAASRELAINSSEELKIINQPNQGAPVARNNGFKISKGEYLLFCDADAVLRKDALEKMVGVLDRLSKKSFGVIPSTSSWQALNEPKRVKDPVFKRKKLWDSSRSLGRDQNDALFRQPVAKIGYVYPNHKFGKKAFRIFPFDERKLKRNNYIHTMALIKREAFPKEGFDPDLRKFQDWDLWLTMLENGYKGVWLDEFLFTYKPREKKCKGEFLPKSLWLPAFVHKVPWKKFGIKIKAIEDYKYWRDVVLKKHGLAKD